MQDSLPAGRLAFAGRKLNPLDRYERFPGCYISSPFPEFILTLDGREHDGILDRVGAMIGPPTKQTIKRRTRKAI
jgi:hypothetical protein